MKTKITFFTAIGILALTASAQALVQDGGQKDERQSSVQKNMSDPRIKVGTKGTVFEVIVENRKDGEPDSYWVLKIGREYLLIVFSEGENKGLVSGAEIDIQDIRDGEITEYRVTKPFEGFKPKYTPGSKSAGGDILFVPIYKTPDQQTLMTSLDWLMFGNKIGDFYRDISNNAYDLSVIHVAEVIQSNNTFCSWSDANIDSALLQQGFDVETYNHVVYLYLPWTCSTGYGVVNSNRSSTDLFSVAVVSHEIGHNIGWTHAQSEEGEEYGNYVSVMGFGFASYNPGPSIIQPEEITPTSSLILKFPMKPSVNQIQQMGWNSVQPVTPFNQSQQVILSALSTNGDEPNYIDLDGFSEYLEYRCDIGVDTEAVAAYPAYRRGLFYYKDNLFMDADPDSNKRYFKQGQIYYKGNYTFSYTNLTDCKASVDLKFVPAKNLELLDNNDGDLIGVGPTFTSTEDQVVFNYSTLNTGGMDIDEEFTEGLYVKNGDQSQDWNLVSGQTRTVAGLAAGDTLPGSFTWIPTSCGYHWFTVRTDISEDVIESDEDDNGLPESEGLFIYVFCYDYGDAPDPSLGTGPSNYNTTKNDYGAVYDLSKDYYLGNCVDADNGLAQNNGATADDVQSSSITYGICAIDGDDEDGAVFLGPEVINGKLKPSRKVKLKTATGGIINAWIDWNKNGKFSDAGEQIFTDMSLNASADFETFPYSTPTSVPKGFVYARVRISQDGGEGPIGSGEYGEVEDYRFNPTGIIETEPQPPVPNGDGSGKALIQWNPQLK